ncbi:MAG TPA: serine/threonine-protein kinase, partial [Kofleriaceae bacterium]|nr:serine/threonine-protein kinase [Kofleriaceae bacterium]
MNPDDERAQGAGPPAGGPDDDATATAAGAVPGDVIAPVAPGGRIGRFVVVGLIGAGGMGIVLEGRDPELHRKVAIKVLRGGGEDRILREAQAMARVAHPNTITVYEVGRAGSELFIAMEHVDGVSLAAWLARAPRTWREIVVVLLGAGRGLAAIHAAGLVHRDFKPDNVLVRADGRPQVGDFGLADEGVGLDGVDVDGAAPGASLSVGGRVIGTPRYMAPEQWSGGAVDARSDQFAYGVTLWTALFGASPFEGDTAEALRSSVIADRRRARPAGTRVPAAVVAV